MRRLASGLIAAGLAAVSILLPVAIQAKDAGGAAPAQEQELEYLLFMELPKVITATLTSRSSLLAPAAMTVVTGQEIRDSGARTLTELLDRLNGVRTHSTINSVSLIALRGITSKNIEDKFKLLIDGQAIAEPVWGLGMYFFNIDLENVQQIEIMRGPGSALFGTGAFAAVINIITKKPADNPGVKVEAKAGSFNTYSGDFNYAKKYSDDLAVGLHLCVYDTKGSDNLTVEKDSLYGQPFGLSPGKVKDVRKTYQVGAKIVHKNLRLDLNYSNTNIDLILPNLSIITQAGAYRKTDYGYLAVNYDVPVTETLTIRNAVSYHRFKYQEAGEAWPNNFDLAKSLGYPFSLDINGDGIFEVWPDGAGYDYGYGSNQYKAQTILDNKFSETNELIVGFFYENISTNNTYVKANVNPLYLFRTLEMTDWTDTCNWNKNAKRSIYGVFAQDEWNFIPDWYLLLGGRYDRYSDFGRTVNPRLGLVWDYNKVGGVLKLLYSNAFKAPTFGELYAINNPVLVGNENLKAEKIASQELIWEHIFMNKVHSNISVYTLTTKDLIEIGRGMRKWVGNGKWKNWGLEMEEKYVFKKNAYAFVGYTYTATKDIEADTELSLIPRKHTGIAGFNLQPLAKLNWNTRLAYTDKWKREAGDTRTPVSAVTVVDTSLRYTYTANWEFQVSGFDLFNKKLYGPSILAETISDTPLNGRSFMVSASYKF